MQLMATSCSSFLDHKQPKQHVDVVASDFEVWNKQYQYRTSYRDMNKRKPAKAKQSVIPGYTGHIPGIVADTRFGKRVTQLALEEFNRKHFDRKHFSRTTEVFAERPLSSETRRFGGGLEDEYQTVSHLYGKTTIPEPHPNFGESVWETTQQAAYSLLEGSPPDLKKRPRLRTLPSGFAANSLLCDGFGWRPLKHLEASMRHTEYRTRFHMYLPFHPKPLKPNLRTMKRKSLVY